jgi:hypothetical protein
MKTKLIGLVVLMAAGFGVLSLPAPRAAEPAREGGQTQGVYIDTRKIEEAEAKGQLAEERLRRARLSLSSRDKFGAV